MNDIYLKQLENKVKHSKSTRIQRLLKDPTLIYLRAIKEVSKMFGKTIRVKTKTFWGDDMFLILPERVSYEICMYGFFEEELTKMILKYLKPGMTFFDIGAHLGYYTLLGSRIVGDNGQVHAFEPTPSTFEILNSNTKNRRNIYTNNLAVFSKTKTISFTDYGPRWFAYNTIYKDRFDENTVRIKKINLKNLEIQAITLDKYIYNKNILPDFIKIDVEGAEYDVLQGMKNILTEIRPIITLEVGKAILEGIMSSRDLILYLTNQRYQPYEFNGERIVKHEPKDQYGYGNILFLPK